MAVLAIGSIVGAQQRKTAKLVDLGDIGHDPGIGRMASFALKPNGLLVHVGMA